MAACDDTSSVPRTVSPVVPYAPVVVTGGVIGALLLLLSMTLSSLEDIVVRRRNPVVETRDPRIIPQGCRTIPETG